MKRIIYIFILFVLMPVFFISCSKCSQKKSSTAKVLSRIQQTGVIRVGTDFVGTPFAFYKDGKETGFEVELVTSIAKALNAKIEWVKIPFGVEHFIKALESDKVDIVIESISLTKDRAEKLLFSNPYFIAGQAVVLRKDENVPDHFELNLLKDKKVGIEKGTTGERFAKNNTTSEIVEYSGSQKSIDALLNGEIYAIISDILSTQTTEWPLWKKLKVVLKNLTHEEYCIITKKGEDALIEKVNQTLKELKSDPIDGIYAKLYRKWFY